jgi:hypothetical protein
MEHEDWETNFMPNTAAPTLDAAISGRESIAQRPLPESAARNATDDEILGLMADAGIDDADAASRDAEAEREFESGEPAGEALDLKEGRQDATDAGRLDENSDPARVRAVFESNPELRRPWDDAKAYRGTFASSEDARAATALQGDLNRMDAWTRCPTRDGRRIMRNLRGR